MSAYQVIPIKALVPSENNYRRSFDQSAFDELVASIKAKGVIQPIHVRPMGKDVRPKGKYEIVAGHRRHKAAISAGLKELPAIVLNLTDEEALEIQVIENTQREDPNPMDEAVGFKRLLEMGKHTPETLAEKIGHSTKYVLTRIRLLGLIDAAQELVAAGELSLGHALLVSRLKNTADQSALLEMIQRGDGMTVRQASARMGSFSADLADADFDRTACETCTARTRNQADLFPALSAAPKDECLDRECYYDKTLAHWGQWLDEKRQAGFQIITDGEEVPHRRDETKAIIVSSLEKKNWKEEYPKDYAKKCAKCKKHHAFFLYEDGTRSHRSIERGELCLNLECLDKMNRVKINKGGEDEGEDREGMTGRRMDEWEKVNLANACMNRFLREGVISQLNSFDGFYERVIVSQLFDHLINTGDPVAFLKEFLPDFDPQADNAPSLYEMNEAWGALRVIPGEKLPAALESLSRHILPTDDRVLLVEMAKDACVDRAEFTIDAEYLEAFFGQDLRELVAELWPDVVPLVLTDLDDTDDEKVRELILAQDLNGRLPKELREEETDKGEEED